MLASKSGTTIEPNSLAAHFRRIARARRRRPLGRSLRRDHRRGHRARGPCEDRRVSRTLHQPRRHRRALLGVVVFRARAGGSDGSRRRGDPRLGHRDARRSRSHKRAGGESSRGPRRRDGRRRAKRQRQGHAGDAAALRTVRPLGRAARRRKYGQTGCGHRANRGRTPRIARRVWERSALRPPAQREQRRDARARDRQACVPPARRS